MTRETRVGLLVGLLLIFGFGMAVSELTVTHDSRPAPGAATREVDPAARPGRAGGAPPTHPVGASPRRGARRPDVDLGREGDPRNRRTEAPARSRGSRVHTVKANENLTSIAKLYYGASQGQRWRLIYDANRNVLESPNVLPTNARLVIPPLPE